MVARDRLGDKRECFEGDFLVLELNERDAEHIGFEAAHLVVGDKPFSDQHRSDIRFCRCRFFLCALEVRSRDQSRVENELFQLFLFDTHGRCFVFYYTIFIDAQRTL